MSQVASPAGLDNAVSGPRVARLAMAVGLAAIAADVGLGLLAVDPVLGRFNDVANASVAVLAAGLVWSLRSQVGSAATAAGLAGAAIGVVGSGLILSGTTGWFLAGTVSVVGFGLIGPSIAAISRSDGIGLDAAGGSEEAREAIPRGLARLGQLTGWTMAMGVLGVIPAAMAIDDAAAAPWWAWIPSIGWLGTYLLLPAWAIWLGRRMGRDSR